MRVLIVDDHPLFCLGLSSLLDAWGETVVGTAGGGQAALEQARAARPDLVFMDVHLPDMSGFEATELIKAELPRVKVVMLTADDNLESEARSLRSGADAYLLKDMAEDAFRRALESINVDLVQSPTQPTRFGAP